MSSIGHELWRPFDDIGQTRRLGGATAGVRNENFGKKKVESFGDVQCHGTQAHQAWTRTRLKTGPHSSFFMIEITGAMPVGLVCKQNYTFHCCLHACPHAFPHALTHACLHACLSTPARPADWSPNEPNRTTVRRIRRALRDPAKTI